jgi:hypothetical protein
MRYCPKFRGVLRKSEDSGGIVAMPTRCKSWKCAYCARINARKLAASIAASIDDMPVSWAVFGTLTAPGGKRRTPVSTHAAIRKSWQVVKQAIQRKWGRFEYILIYERHKSGCYHAHLILLWLICPVPNRPGEKLTRQIKDGAHKYGLGRQAKFIQIMDMKSNSKGVIAYATKAVRSYLSKDAAQSAIDLPKGARLYYASSAFRSIWDESSKEGEWEMGGRLDAADIKKGAYSIPDKRLLTYDDLSDEGFWPIAPAEEDHLF